MDHQEAGTISRRSLLLGAAAIAGFCARAQQASANDRVNLAVIGCKNRGHQVATAAIKSGQFNIAALCDCDDAMYEVGAKALSEHLASKPRFEKDFRRVLDDTGIDAIVVAVPDHWHAMMSCMALDAGKHVYLEKPASYCIADGKAMVAAGQRHPKLAFQVGTQQRSAAHFHDAKAFIKSGGLGKVGFARAWTVHDRGVLEKVADSAPPSTLDYDMWLGPAPMKPFNKNRVHYVWRFIRDYGTGEMGNWGAHWIDTVLFLLDMGYPVSVSGMGGQYVVKDGKEWPDTQTVLYEYPDFTLLWELRIWSEFNYGGAGTAAQIDGEKGSIVITRKGWTFNPKDAEPQAHKSTNDMEVDHAKNFAESIRGASKPIAPIDEGHKTATLCHLANISVDLNRRLAFDGATQSIVGDEEGRKREGREYRAPWKLA
jgi:predicted dehydrogenase